jgi:4-amino-4-deoxy-L-arabinose transferase-like glycosyltransferase
VTRDRAIAAGLAIFVVATRLPFVAHALWEWDSVLYARALEQGFHVSADIADQRPHPPGYVFYVAAAALFRSISGNSNTALVAIAVIASAGATVAVYLVARRFARAELAAFAALAFAVDPLVWAHGDIALPYIVLALGSCGLALAFWDARRGSARRALAASVAFGLAAGFRQDLLLLLGPLWLWTMASGGPRRVAIGAIAVAVACLAWLVPSAILSGGFGEYVGAVLSQSAAITGESVVGTSDGNVLWYDLRFTILALAWGLFALGLVLLGLALAPALHWARRPRRPRVGPTGAFFLLWLLPGLVIYLAWIIGDWGYVLSILPGLYVLCAALLERALGSARGIALIAWRAFAVALLAATALFFVATDARWSAGGLADHDRSVAGRVSYVRGHFPADTTVLLAREDYQLARYYLSEYRAWLYDPSPAQIVEPPKSGAGTVVIFTPDLVLRQAVGATAPDARAVGLTVIAAPSVKLFGVDPIAREP